MGRRNPHTKDFTIEVAHFCLCRGDNMIKEPLSAAFIELEKTPQICLVCPLDKAKQRG